MLYWLLYHIYWLLYDDYSNILGKWNNISLTWILRPFGDDFPIKTMIPGHGRSEVVIKFTQIYGMYIKSK
jgi:hypothetical protein